MSAIPKVSKLPHIDRSVRLSSINEFSSKLETLTEELRDQILAPKPRKVPPTFTSSQIMEMCELDRARFNYLINKEGYPGGQLSENGRIRHFSLSEAREWVVKATKIPRSPLLSGESANGKVLLVSQLKGGSSKTTTAMCLAQGLNMRGRRVLLIDLDPQASLTELCGIYAEQDVREDNTVLPFIYEPNEVKMKDLVKETYWEDISIIPAHPSLFGAEFHLPAMTLQKADFKFWAVLREGINALREDYDYIILDTAPSLSYLTINALFAADAMVMPLVPESLDFISSVSFWSLLSDLSQTIIKRDGDKVYDFISVLLSKVDYGATSSAPVVRSWAERAYGEWLNKLEVPASSAMSSGALSFSTVFDLSSGDANRKTLQRVRDPLEAYCRWIDEHYSQNWRAV